MFKKIIQYFLSIGSNQEDSEALRLKKSSLILVPLIIAPLAVIWGVIYIYLDHYIAAAIPLSYSVISIFNLWHLQKTKNIVPLQDVQMVLVLLLPFFLMWSLGGFALGSFVFIWAFYAPIASLTYGEDEKTLCWFYAFLALVLLSTLVDQWLTTFHIGCMPHEAIELFYFLNVAAGLAGIYFLLRYFIGEKDRNAHRALEKEHKALLVASEELRIVNEKFIHLANHDSLTNIANRYLLRDSLKKMLSLAKRQNYSVALLFLDLDGFKNINDTYGHAIGDEVLKSVANRLKPLLREEDLIARIGGDEFAIAMAIGSLTELDFVNQVSQRILDEVSKDYENILSADSIGVSIGISFFPDDALDIDTLINNADEAMYKVKASGKNAYQTYK